MDRKTLTGLILILFLFASWSIGNVMSLSPTLDEDTQTFDFTISWLWIYLPLLIVPLFIVLKSKSPTILMVSGSLVAMGLAPYLFLRYGILWPSVIIITIFLLALMYWKGLGQKGMSAYFVVIALGGLLLLIVTYFGTGGDLIPIQTEGNGEGLSLPWDNSRAMVEHAFGSMGTFILVLLIAAVLLFLLVQRVIPLLRKSEEEGSEKDIEYDISSTVDEAIKELHKGKDVKSTILRCYQRMCNILEKKGVKDTEFTTPREFEKRAINNIHVSASKITEIRKLFEIAKYSQHELGEKERDRAVRTLKDIQEELG